MTTTPGGPSWSQPPITELVVAYDPAPLIELVARRRGQLRSRLASLGVSVLVVVGFAIWLRSRGQVAGSWLTFLVLIVAVGWVVGYLVAYLRARRALAGVGTGTAVRIDRSGVTVADLRLAWPEVAGLRAVRGGIGREDRLQLAATDGRVGSVPLSQIDVRPAALDSTTRALSGGRHGVDLSQLDS